MTTHAYVVKEMHVKIDATDYQCEVTGVDEGETHSTATLTVACPDGTVNDVGPSSYTLTIGYSVSLLPDSFFRLLDEHAGEAATISVEPNPVTEPGYMREYDVTLIGGPASWQVGAFGQGPSVTLPVNGAPRTIEPTP